MKYLKTYELKKLNFNKKFIILKYFKGGAELITLFELSRSKASAKTLQTHYNGGQTIKYQDGDVLYKFYQTYIILPNEYELLYETDSYSEALENFKIIVETNKYNL